MALFTIFGPLVAKFVLMWISRKEASEAERERGLAFIEAMSGRSKGVAKMYGSVQDQHARLRAKLAAEQAPKP
jgi:hypothetical protein